MPIDAVRALEAADALVRAIESASPDALREIYEPDAVVWHNTDRIEQSRDEVIAGVEWLRSGVEIRMDVRQREATQDGFLHTHEWVFTPPSGEPLRLFSAFVVVLDDDYRVRRLDEYIDSADLAALVALVEAQQGVAEVAAS